MYLITDDLVTKYFIWSNINNCVKVANTFVCGFNEIIHNSVTDPTCVTEILKKFIAKPIKCDTLSLNLKKSYGTHHF